MGKLYYMRDNNSFRELPENVERAIEALREEWDAGNTGGMLCSKRKAGVVHAPIVNFRDREEVWREFEKEAREWLTQQVNHLTKKVVKLYDEVQIAVVVDSKGGGLITHSSLGSELGESKKGRHYADAIESMVLAQACAGIDIESRVYADALITTLETMQNRF